MPRQVDSERGFVRKAKIHSLNYGMSMTPTSSVGFSAACATRCYLPAPLIVFARPLRRLAESAVAIAQHPS